MDLPPVCAALKEAWDFSSRTYEWERKSHRKYWQAGQFESAKNRSNR